MTLALTLDLVALPAFMTEEEVARYLRIEPKKLRRLGYEKRGPKTKKICGVHRIARADLIAWMAEQ